MIIQRVNIRRYCKWVHRGSICSSVTTRQSGLAGFAPTPGSDKMRPQMSWRGLRFQLSSTGKVTVALTHFTITKWHPMFVIFSIMCKHDVIHKTRYTTTWSSSSRTGMWPVTRKISWSFEIVVFLRYASGQSLYRQADRNNLDPSRERSNNFQIFFRWTACSDTDAGLFTSIG